MEQLNMLDGQIIPQIGFGTYKLNGMQGAHAIVSALDQGYRLLDTAYNYENEGTVGKAIEMSNVPRDQIIITSKLPGRYQDYDASLTAIQESIYRLGVEYLDLYLIHWPNPKQGKYIEAWQAMIDAQKAGLVKSIGVCNFLPEHIETLEKETGVLPVINQIELHPYFNQREMVKYNASKGIVTQAWSPLGRASNVINDEKITEIADKHNKTIPQVILKWHIQNGVVPIPKSTSVARQFQNIDIFDFYLDSDDLEKIDTLTREDGRRKDQDPAVYEEF
ncbi:MULTISPECIES: aldo/keto reductase [Staphylococcus]|jgi:diketogulonate reductase-like aldo/keto reductase|uniref:Aldo keto reductase n=1 Tax=Staphylococcus nepalensis TaxID=214473 RepID=A0A291JL55_9STAP|nr:MULTISPECIES: aldo/keto reductase [Staphylococcus]VDG67137.1 2,5-didehydrogluconate reductase [Lacrimispora indolis]ATH60127.1 2,5-diketo-D-gluconic acid reductase [Staphylococcus nepalensis]ATH65217.1 2,5-diketo-D-gluconic acid reductase [Staphylococcus nepalensis]AWI44585.1 2,5-diketo-D-gluconic acid reductase [Staphylococcus nepalensis]MBO1204909.1 aldo/keto reductase [Staphylococcus nepalensis]